MYYINIPVKQVTITSDFKNDYCTACIYIVHHVYIFVYSDALISVDRNMGLGIHCAVSDSPVNE